MERWAAMRRSRRGCRLVGVLCLLALAAAPAAARADVGHRDFSFTASSVEKPSGQKPQSKLWFNDGTWWGSLFAPGPQEYHIFRLDPLSQQWVDTGTPLDPRNSSEADVLWDGSHLYVASSSDITAGIQVFQFGYNPGTRSYALQASQTINAGPVEAVVLDKDSGGRLWLTYTQTNPADASRRTVFVAHTEGGTWGAPFALPGTNTTDLSNDDISAIVAFAGRIGVMWSNQNAQAFLFAAHVDGAPDAAWTETAAMAGPFSTDDHINLKSLQGTGGDVLAAVKTSKQDKMPRRGTDDQVDLLKFSGGAWSRYVFGTVADDHTRPIVLTDQATRRLYVVATSPTNLDPADQRIFYKSTSLDAPAFPPGLGTILMAGTGRDVNDASSTKQDLGALPSGLVLGSDATNYWHNEIPLGHAGPPAPGPAARDVTAPRLTRLSIRPRAPRRRRIATVRFSLSEPATVRLAAERPTRGRRVGGGCVRQTRANRSRRRCTRFVVERGATAVRARAGRSRVRFRVPAHTGAHRLAAVATDAAGNASRRRVSFRIRR